MWITRSRIPYHSYETTDSTISFSNTRKLQQGCDLKAFFYFSTDEVFGPALVDVIRRMGSPQADEPVFIFETARVFASLTKTRDKIPLMIVNVMNAFVSVSILKSLFQCIRKVMKGEKVHIHSYPDKKRAGLVFTFTSQTSPPAILIE